MTPLIVLMLMTAHPALPPEALPAPVTPQTGSLHRRALGGLLLGAGGAVALGTSVSFWALNPVSRSSDVAGIEPYLVAFSTVPLAAPIIGGYTDFSRGDVLRGLLNLSALGLQLAGLYFLVIPSPTPREEPSKAARITGLSIGPGAASLHGTF